MMHVGTFPEERLRLLEAMEESHFWFQGRRRLISRLMKLAGISAPATVLDIGAGAGAFSISLAGRGFSVTAVDFLSSGLMNIHRRASNVSVLQSSAEHLALRANAANVVLLLDVLEHLDDSRVLREAARCLNPSGWLVLTVPAFPWLWSYRDEAAGHLRRYRKGSLMGLLRAHGFEPLVVEYYQCLLFPIVIVSRVWSRRHHRVRDWEDAPPRFLHAGLGFATRLEGWLASRLRMPFGSSIAVVARRQSCA